MSFIERHNQNIALVNQSLPMLGGYGIKHIAYIELYHKTNKALVLSNVTGLIEVFHNLGKFSDNFYISIQKAQSHVARTFLWPSNPSDDVGLSLKAIGLSNGMTIIQKDAHSIKTWAFIGGYSASKYALRGFNDSLFKELSPYGIKVTSISPSVTDTDMSTDFPGFKDGEKIQTQDIAKTVVFLLSLSGSASIQDIEIYNSKMIAHATKGQSLPID